jgi:hypothetical protein
VPALQAVLAMLDETEHAPLRRVCRAALDTAITRAAPAPR